MGLVKFIKRLKHKSRRISEQGLPKGIGISQYLHPVVGSHSQYGEDLIIDALLQSRKVGTYVDIGANDPALLSNTERFYRRGWSGVNIEPDRVLFDKLSRDRVRDINLNIGVGPERSEMTFYRMSADTLSSFDKQAALEGGRLHGAKLISTVPVSVKPLMDIFEEHLAGRQVDFMSVDAEGFDLAVLRSNDWSRFRPVLLVVEINQGGLEIIQFLDKNKYILVYSNGTNGIFVDINRKAKQMPE